MTKEEQPRHARAENGAVWQRLEHALTDQPPHVAREGPNCGPVEWLRAALVRAVKTAAQSALAAIPATVGTIGGVDWCIVAGTAALAAVMSILTSMAGIPEVQDGTSLPQLNT